MALIKCPECGREISSTVTECPHCGYQLRKRSQKVGLNDTQKKQILIICLIAVAVIAIVLGGYFVTKLDSSQQAAVVSLNNQMEKCIQTKIKGKSTDELSEYKRECLKLVEDYDQMEWKQRIRVAKHKEIEKRIKEIDIAVDNNRNNAVAHVSELIDAIKEVSLESEADIKEADNAYLQLDDKQRKEVKNYAELEEAKVKYDELCVNETITLINKIGKVSLENGAGSRINRAEKLYNSLTSQGQNNVTNYKTLQQKRDKYNKLNGYRRHLKKAKANMRAGKLNAANRHLKKVPSKFKFKNLKASKLKKQMKAKNAWVKLCGQWKTTSGIMRVYEIYDDDGSWENWESKLSNGQKTISVHCKLLDNGKVKLQIHGSVPCYTEYSSISEGLERGNISLNKTVTVSGMGTIRINKHTTMTLSTSGISVNYYKVDPNESQYFTYKYTTSMRCGKRIQKF